MNSDFKAAFSDPPNILVVDDDLETLKQVCKTLSSNNYEVRPALNGRLALEALQFQLPDLIILDVQMPDIDGFELCRQIKHGRNTADIPIVFFSGMSQEENIIKGFNTGATDYITKPIQDLELIARVTTHLKLYRIRQRLSEMIDIRTSELKKNQVILEQKIANGKALEAQLLESKRNHQQVVNALQEMIAVIDADGLVKFCNRQFKRMLTGDATAVLEGKNLRAIIPEDMSAQLIDKIRLSLSSNDQLVEEVIIELGSRHRWFRISLYPMKFGQQDSIAALTILLEVTKEKQAEEKLKQKRSDLQKLSMQLIRAQEDERKFVSLELHDEIGQELTAMKINLESIEQELCSTCLGKIDGRLIESIDVNEQILNQIREISLNLRPSLLDHLGLLPTLNWYVSRFSKRTGISTLFEPRITQKRFSPETEITLYRVVQESLTNITKHSQAETARIELEIMDYKIVLTIKDDGIGFNPEELNGHPDQYRGIGLIGIRERVELLSGSFKLESQKGLGSKISITLPDN